MKHRLTSRMLLGHPAERRTLGLGSLGLLGVLLPYTFALWRSMQGFDAAVPWGLHVEFWFALLGFALLGLQVIGSYIGNGINHNHSHRPTMATRNLNRIFNVVLTLIVGYPVSVLKIIHGLNHHGEFGSSRDWSGTHQLDSMSFGGLIRYTLRAFRSMNQPEAKARELRSRPALEREIRREARMLLVFVALLFTISPLTFLIITLPAWVLSNFAAVMINAIQHGGCDLKSPTHHSVNFTGSFYNFWLCNNGYHTWHHDHTDVHWSDLPARHREQLDRVLAPQLNQRNFLKYVWRAYGPGSTLSIKDPSKTPLLRAWPVQTEFDPTHPSLWVQDVSSPPAESSPPNSIPS
jgi:beta-carotene hydroxylase